MRFILSINSKIISLIIIFLLIFSIHPAFASGLTIEKQSNPSESYNEYIVELVDKPLFNFISNIRDRDGSFLSSSIDDYKDLLLQGQEKVKNKILSLVDPQKRNEIKITDSFYGIFNGLCIKNIPESCVEDIKGLSFVKDVFPNYRLKVCLDESVPLINATKVWNLYDKYGNKMTGKGIKIAILDSGVDYTHPDLADSYAGGYDFINNDNNPMDDDGHGTHCAGILVGNGNSSDNTYVGVAPDAELYVYKILNDTGKGDLTKLIQGLEAALDPNDDNDPSDHVDIISLSFGTENPGSPDSKMSSKIDEIVDMGVIAVVAAGNEGSNGITSPGCSIKAITVGSVDKSKLIATSSSRGPVEFNGSVYIKPDLVAPGVGIQSTKLGGGYTTKSGTSMATPHVAGAAALLLQSHPNWTPSMIKNELKNTAEDLGEPGEDNTYGSGLVDIFNAVNQSSAEPIAILDTPYSVPNDLVDIIGTAMNGTGNSKDFVNYSIQYEDNNSWIKICENNEEILDDVLCIWNTTNIEKGFYKIKLKVIGKDLAKVIIKDIVVGYNLDSIIISAPSEVDEKTNFTVNLTDINRDPVNAFVILYAPFSIPRIRYGSNIQFKAPNVFRPFADSIEGKIFVFKFNRLRNSTAKIKILNNRVSIL